MELWQSDGTETGTHIVKDIRQGEMSSSTDMILLRLGTNLVFPASDGYHGTELWRMRHQILGLGLTQMVATSKHRAIRTLAAWFIGAPLRNGMSGNPTPVREAAAFGPGPSARGGT